MIADKIKALREAKGITQAELARSLSITRGGVNSWEQGFSTPSPASIVELAKFFGEGKHYANGIFPVLVEADAIQADGFANATDAFTAFDKK